MPVYAALSAFNAGELSPKMIARTDVEQYRKGCRALKNFVVTPYGSVERRPGTRFVAQAAGTCRLIPFVFSSTVAYVCEFSAAKIRFYRDGAHLSGADVATPYSADDLAGLQFVQSADVMTLVHPDHPVKELRRTAADTFALADKTFEFPPMLEPNLADNHKITPSAQTGDITLTATHNTFAAGNVGGYFQLIHTRKANEIAKDFTANGTSASLEVKGYWTFTTHGTWTGTLTIQRSFDGGSTWSDFRTYSSANDSNVSTSGEEEEDGALYRLQMEDYAQSATGTLKLCRCLFVNPDYVTTGVVKITAYTDAKHVSGTVVKKLGGTAATHEWNEGAWSARRGFPRTVAYYEERMIFGGTAARPQTVWGSRTGDWDDFLLGDKDDDGLEFTLASDTVNTICWMCQHDALIIGTEDSEWTLSSSDSGAALTPSNFRVRRQSVYGSAGIAAQMVGDTVLFVQRGGRKVREFVFQWEKDGYTSPDLTILAEHIAGPGIIATALQRLPDSVLWCVLADGTLAALTYERDQEVVGWHRHETQGDVLSVCVIPDGDADQVWFAVERGSQIDVELMAPRAYAGIEDAFYVDCGKTVSGMTAFSTVSGLDHLEGATVQILADGAVQRPKVVADGTVELDEPARTVTVGLGYESLLSPMPVELETANGMSVTRRKVVAQILVRTDRSVGGECRSGDGRWEQLPARDVLLDRMDAPILPKDDVIPVLPLGGFVRDAVVQVRQTEPLPLNVNSIVLVMDVADR